MRRTLAVLLVPALLALAACSGGGSAEDAGAQPKTETIADVSVTGSWKEAPKVDFQAPASFSKLGTKRVIKGPGKGDAVTAASRVTLRYLGINASDETEIKSSWEEHQDDGVSMLISQVIPGLRKGLLGTHAGDRVALAIPSKLAYDPTGNGTTVEKGDDVVFVVDVLKVAAPSQPPKTVPQLKYTDAGVPDGFTKTDQTPKDVEKLGVYTVMEGDGPKVQSGNRVTVEYVGQLYPSGKVFDKSWGGQPFTFKAGTGAVIKGWDKGVQGQRVGSRLVLVIPSDLGYGKKGSPPTIPGGADLIFVVDILGTSG